MMICKNTNSKLKHINEGANGTDDCILEGIFAELGVMNVNHRIYPEDEYLKHLQYLRDDIKKGVVLLGELDHPDDRFDVRYHEASHQIIDLWYEPEKKLVMGKIKLLNTPNGRLARSIVDQGIPLNISSRAAGSVNPQTNVVSIDQIYTYDLVAKPGFAKAILHRVNESAGATEYNEEAINFLKMSESIEDKNVANKLGIADESVFTTGVEANATLREEAINIENKTININDMTKRIFEADETVDESNKAAEGVTVTEQPELIMANKANESNDNATEEPTAPESTEEPKSDDSKEKSSDSDYEILDVDIVSDSDSEEENKSDDKKDTQEDNNTESTESEEGGESNGGESTPTTEEPKSDKKTDEEVDEKKEEEAEALFDKHDEIVNKKDEIAKKQKNFEDKFAKLVDCIQTKKMKTETVKESFGKDYPFTAYLSEKELVTFSVLNDAQRAKVAQYLNENQIFDPISINNCWRNALTTNKEVEPIWLRLAEPDYRELYNAATPEQKYNLSESAKYLIFESKEDVDNFWMNSGLQDNQERKRMFAEFQNSIPNVQRVVEQQLPYKQSDIDIICEMACSYN